MCRWCIRAAWFRMSTVCNGGPWRLKSSLKFPTTQQHHSHRNWTGQCLIHALATAHGSTTHCACHFKKNTARCDGKWLWSWLMYFLYQMILWYFRAPAPTPLLLNEDGVAVMQKASRQQPHGSCVYNSFAIVLRWWNCLMTHFSAYPWH